jgi:CHAT domain-containing protein
MISFHKHRKQDHVSTVEALQRAQLDVLHNQQPNLPQNYGWAAFVTIGGYAEF